MAVMLLVATSLAGWQPPQEETLIYAVQVTAEEGSDPSPPQDLLDRANDFADDGAGTMKIIHGAGQRAELAIEPVSLFIGRDPGHLEHVARVREEKLKKLFEEKFQEAQAKPVTGAGRDIIGLLSTVSSELGSGQNEVWLRTLGLGTVAPADARLLMAADPAQAVASIAESVPQLPGVSVHLMLAPAAGDQPWMNTLTAEWRAAFMSALLRQAGATVSSVEQVNVRQNAAAGAPHAPVVPNLEYPTPPPVSKPPVTPSTPPVVKLDSSTTFQPDSADFTQAGRVLPQLQAIIDGWSSNNYSRVEVVGHTARFGSPDTARELSQQRAEKVAEMLRQHGVATVTARGVGYDQPLPPNPQDAANRVVIITAYPKK